MTGRSALSHVACSCFLFLISTLLGCAQYAIPKKIVVDGTTYLQNGAGINAAIQAAGSNSEIVLMPGAYSITEPIIINNVQNMTLRILSGSKLLALPESFNGAVSMLSITRSSYVRILGEKGVEFKGFGTPRDCVTVNAPGLADATPVSNVEVSGINCTGTLDGIDAGDSKNFQMNTHDIEIADNFISDTSGPGQINVQATVGAKVHDNVLENPNIGQDQIVCSMDVDCEVYSNVVSGFIPPASGSPQAAMNGYLCQKCAWHNNTIRGVTSVVPAGFGFGGMYCDTCFDFQVTENHLIGGMWGITCEICRNVIIKANLLEKQRNSAIQLYGSTSFAMVNRFSSLTGVKPGTGVVLSEEPAKSSETPARLQVALNGSFRRGVVFQQDVTPSPEPDFRIHVESSRDLPAGSLGLQYCSEPHLRGICHVLSFGAVPARVWVVEDQRFPVMPPFENYKSYAIVALSDLPSAVLEFRDLEADRLAEYGRVEDNQIIQPGVWGINIYEGFENYSVIHNSCEQVGYASQSGISACVIVSDVDQGEIKYLLQYGTVEGNQATAAVGAASAYGIRAYALGNSVNDSLLVQANRWDVANPSFFSRVTHLILGPSLQAEDSCGQDPRPLPVVHNGCDSQNSNRHQFGHP